jgi:hypothetical protein
MKKKANFFILFFSVFFVMSALNNNVLLVTILSFSFFSFFWGIGIGFGGVLAALVLIRYFGFRFGGVNFNNNIFRSSLRKRWSGSGAFWLFVGLVVLVCGTGTVMGGPVVSAGYEHTCVLVQGKVACWGLPPLLPSWGNSVRKMTSLIPLSFLSSTLAAQQVTAGDSSSCVIFSNNMFVCFGSDLYRTAYRPPVDTIPFYNTASSPVTQVVITFSVSCVLHGGAALTGAVRCWGTTGDYTGSSMVAVIYAGSSPIIFDQPTIVVTQISGLGYHVCALFSNQRVRCWGGNGAGELGQVKKKVTLKSNLLTFKF